MSVPSFAVLGHPNKGKSSIVAAMAHDKSVAISAVPGTTVFSESFPMSVDGTVLYNLIDTPGFQRPRKVLEWLKQHETTVDKHPEVLKLFVENKSNQKTFPDETRLLKPVLEGAGIVYVVDGSVPYGAEYEAEMEILRWTAQPSLAIVNPIGGEEFVEQWTKALRQFFNVVHVFNPLTASFEKRLELLSSFSNLEPAWKKSLEHAVEILREDRLKHIERSAKFVSNALFDILSQKKEVKFSEKDISFEKKAKASYRKEIIKKEAKVKNRIDQLYAQDGYASQGSLIDELDRLELFSNESWKLFGLSRKETTTLAALSGAAMGSAIDVSSGGASLFLGALTGGLIGAGAVLLGGEKLVETKVLMLNVGNKVLVIGPVKNPTFGFVLLSRIRLHHMLVAERSHASRESISVNDALDVFLEPLEFNVKSSLDKIFRRIRDESVKDDDLEKLHQIIGTLFKKDLMKSSKTITV